MLKAKMLEALNSHLNEELYSSYLYLAMASDAESKGLPGFAHWLKLQVQEELIHVEKFYKYINDRGGKVVLKAIKEPPSEWGIPMVLFQAVYDHEVSVTEAIHKLVEIASELKDYSTNAFLQWFINEQVEEESSVSDIVNKIKLIGDKGDGLFMLDKELGTRVLTPSA